MNSPFRYPGGKYYLRKYLSKYISDHKGYCEPLCGGASLFFYKDKCQYNILNDIDEKLILTYEVIKDNPYEMIQVLDNFKPISKESHHYYKNNYKPLNKIESASLYFYMNRCSFNGIMKSVNQYFGYNEKYSMKRENWHKNILRCSDRLHNVKLYSHDMCDIINKIPDNFIVYVDPPYFDSSQNGLYKYSFKYEDHLRLCKCIKENKNRLHFIISYDNSDEIIELYNFMNYIDKYEINYFSKRSDYSNKKRSHNIELIIHN